VRAASHEQQPLVLAGPRRPGSRAGARGRRRWCDYAGRLRTQGRRNSSSSARAGSIKLERDRSVERGACLGRPRRPPPSRRGRSTRRSDSQAMTDSGAESRAPAGAARHRDRRAPRQRRRAQTARSVAQHPQLSQLPALEAERDEHGARSAHEQAGQRPVTDECLIVPVSNAIWVRDERRRRPRPRPTPDQAVARGPPAGERRKQTRAADQDQPVSRAPAPSEQSAALPGHQRRDRVRMASI